MGLDGRTAETRRTGESWRRLAFHDLRTRDNAERTAPSTWFLRNMCNQGRTRALLVMTAEGILRGSGARRMPGTLRWSTAGWDDLQGFMGSVTKTEGTSSARLGVRRRCKEGRLISATHVHYRGGCEKVRTEWWMPRLLLFYGWTCVRRFLTTISKKFVLLNCCSSKNLAERGFESHRSKKREAGEVVAEPGDKGS